VPVQELKSMIQNFLGKNAGPEPKEGIFPEEPHPPVENKENTVQENNFSPHTHDFN
jgi:hypothetical protein